MFFLAQAPERRYRRGFAALWAVTALSTWTTIALAAPGSPAPGAEPERPGQWTVSTGAHYSTGHYGTSTTTDVLYVPVTVRYDNTLGAASLTVPYLALHGRGEAVQGNVVLDAESDETVSSAGLGDVVATLTYTAYRGTAPWPWLDLTAVAKFGTGDPDKELGTGKNDYTAQVDAYQRIGVWNWFTTLGYKVPGSTGTVTYQRVFYASAGASHPIGEAFKAGLMWSGQQPLIEGADSQQDVTAFGSWAASPRNTVSGYLSGGLTHASPERAVGITFARTFGG